MKVCSRLCLSKQCFDILFPTYSNYQRCLVQSFFKFFNLEQKGRLFLSSPFSKYHIKLKKSQNECISYSRHDYFVHTTGLVLLCLESVHHNAIERKPNSKKSIKEKMDVKQIPTISRTGIYFYFFGVNCICIYYTHSMCKLIIFIRCKLRRCRNQL